MKGWLSAVAGQGRGIAVIDFLPCYTTIGRNSDDSIH
jgi:hypothetical protein